MGICDDRIAAKPSPAVVMLLEVTRSFVEAIMPSQVVDLVDRVEELGDRSVNVRLGIDVLAFWMLAPPELVVEGSAFIVLRAVVELERVATAGVICG